VTYSSLSEKRCPDCGLTKPAEAFSRNAARPDGLQFYCKECYSTRSARAYRERRIRKGLPVRAGVVAPPGHKYCPGCCEVSPLSNWHRNASSRDGYASYCKTCRRVQGEADHLRRTFGLSIAERDDLFAAQGGLCAICRARPIRHIDHDHPTGQLRGGLCGPCNMGLGQFEDDPQRLRAAARYLDMHRQSALRLVMDAGWWGGESPIEVHLRKHLAS
jgi:hypothetical protein